MLDRLVASRPERSRGSTVASGAFAVLLHGGLATAAIIATWPAPHLPPPVFVPLDGPLYYPTPRTTRPAGPATPALPSADWTIPDVDVPSVPVADFGALPSVLDPGVPGAPPSSGASGLGSFSPGAGAAAPGNTLYAERTVDEPPVILAHPALEYPALLRTAGVEGMVVFEVVIDSTGLPEPATLRLLATSHQGFVAPATRVVLGARFRPGRAHGRPVRVLIRQPITFRLKRGATRGMGSPLAVSRWPLAVRRGEVGGSRSSRPRRIPIVVGSRPGPDGGALQCLHPGARTGTLPVVIAEQTVPARTLEYPGAGQIRTGRMGVGSVDCSTLESVRTRLTDNTRTIRFIRAQIEQRADDSCEATVEIEHRGVGVFSGTAQGPLGQQDQLRAVARATSDALSDAFEAKGARVRVVSVHLVETLTQTAVLVVLAVSRGADSQSLLGICDAKSDPVRAAALAVLNATNRFLGLLDSQME